MNNNKKTISFSINEYGWILLFQKLGKTILRAEKIKNRGRVSDESSQHRMFEIEAEGGVKVRSKLYDISKF
jgi:hypothetical protein